MIKKSAEPTGETREIDLGGEKPILVDEYNRCFNHDGKPIRCIFHPRTWSIWFERRGSYECVSCMRYDARRTRR